ncbi:lyase family protein [Microbacterium sp. LRZ72]|uniref:lyase family protein n=1 Tax=Microbacterium sp. LRZ72 TaxID=2942481 RepID=UPI0029BC0ADA|nr:lyase family protein [Microbacterium sp. LRZ72]MDX2376389.1 lyase family protein [Microbacterium sp. LRZ72]
MASEAAPESASGRAPEALDSGLLSPVSAGLDDVVSDAAVLSALVAAEVSLTRAYAAAGLAPASVAEAVAARFGWDEAGARCRGHGLDAGELARAAVVGGNPVIPLVGMMKDRVPAEERAWIHRGATSQDIVDSALMRVAADAADEVLASLGRAEAALRSFIGEHADDVAAARTLTQHAVPTTVGLRAANWLRGVSRARAALAGARAALPAQLAGAGGTLASFVEITGSVSATEELVRSFARSLGLAAPDAPWHTTRWPVTELGDALVQAVDAAGKIAADVATLSRTEIGEVAEGTGGGSSAMPQKQNPARAVLIRSAALRAPALSSTLHLAAALAVDERPDGAWHAEWPTLRELLRLALGASSHTAQLVAGLRVDPDAVARNLAATRGLILSERVSIVLGPLIGPERLKEIVAAVGRGDDLADRIRRLPEAAALDVDALLDPAGYTGLAASLTENVLKERS